MQDIGSILAEIERRAPHLRLTNHPNVTRVGGRSNDIYRIDVPGSSFALRLPGPDAGPFIDRAREIEAARMASKLGTGPALIDAQDSGIMLTRWIDGQVMSADAYRSDPAAVDRAARVVARLHRSGCHLSGRFDINHVLDTYLKPYDQRSGAPSPWGHDMDEAIKAARVALGRSTAMPVPSHCDLVPENCLDTGSRMFLIDWEYAGMNDPAWDLAYLALEADFDTRQEEALLAAYQSSTVTFSRLQIFKCLAGALNLLWDMSQTRHGESRTFPRRTRNMLPAIEHIVQDPRFRTWLADV